MLSGFRWAAWSAMGCFGSPGDKRGTEGDDIKSQKKRSEIINKQLQKDKQVTCPSISTVGLV